MSTRGVAANSVFVRGLLAGRSAQESYQQYRVDLGGAILLGLEFLVVADIVGTVAIDPTFRNLGVLALIVLVRTALSFAPEVEVYGHWPWRTTDLAYRTARGEPPRSDGPRAVP